MSVIWYKNISALWTTPVIFFPFNYDKNLSIEDKINCITRSVLVVILILIFLDRKNISRTIILGLIALTAMVIYYENTAKENFSPFPVNKIIKGRNFHSNIINDIKHGMPTTFTRQKSLVDNFKINGKSY